jgi:hypothetical protein
MNYRLMHSPPTVNVVNGLTQPLTVARIEYVPAGIVPPNILGPWLPNKKYFGRRSVF